MLGAILKVVLKIVGTDNEAKRRGATHPSMALLFHAPFCITRRKIEVFFGTLRGL